jgi:hypothetical protein
MMEHGKQAMVDNVKGLERDGWDIVIDNPEAISGLDMKTLPLASAVWETLSVQQTLDQIKTVPVQAFVNFGPVTNFPATYAFQTRKGATGLLQITGLTDDRSGTKIRYKLVQAVGANTGQGIH